MNAPEQHTPAGREPSDVRLARIEERVGSIQQPEWGDSSGATRVVHPDAGIPRLVVCLLDHRGDVVL